MYKTKPKLPQQFANAEKNGIPFAVVLGEDELQQGKAKIKEMGLPEGHPEKNGVDVSLDLLVSEIKERLNKKSAAVDTGLVGDIEKFSLDG
jgi:histidyl-tRNA synthetase